MTIRPTLIACLAAIALASLSLTACPQDAQSGSGMTALAEQTETFEPTDQPGTFTVDTRNFQGPWGYDKAANASRLYPLVVSGCWGGGATEYGKVAQDYPAFVLDYQKNTVADGEALARWIDLAIGAGYRIDKKRIYLTGFSQGGSGSFPLAQGMRNEGEYFAAILRMAGQSEADLGNQIASKTAVWYHIGLSDTAPRVTVARDSLANFRAYACNASATETSRSDAITGYQRTTVTLTRAGIPMFKYSEYTGMGHDDSPCYRDADLFAWMFARKL